MALSVVEPISPAIERAKRVCFRPFDFGKWLTIGFCAFLAAFAEGGASVPANFNFNMGGGPHSDIPAEDIRTAIDWIQAHLLPIVLIGLGVLVLLVALWAVFIWLGSRGQFMFMDNIVRNRGAVVEPWREYRREGNSLFCFRFLFGLVLLVVLLAVPVAAVFIALPDIQAQRFGTAAGTGLAVFIIGLFIAIFVYSAIYLFLNDFVVPIMYLRRIGVLRAWREFCTSMLAEHIGTFILYFLFKIVIVFSIGLITTLVICCTLCIAALPYLGSHVLLLPLHVFLRSYSLYFIEQFGPEWRIFSTAEELMPELVDEDAEWSDERFHREDERIRPDDDSSRPPDDRFRPG